VSILFIVFGLFLVAACGSPASNKSGKGAQASVTPSATCPSSTGEAMSSTVGTIKSMSGQTFVVADQLLKKDVTVTYSSSTHFARQAHIPASSLKEGTQISVIVTGNNGVYSATSITVLTGGQIGNGPVGPGGKGPGGVSNGTPGVIFDGTPPPGGSSNNGTNQSCSRTVGTPGKSNPPSTSSKSIFGKVGQMNGNILTVIDTTGASYTVTLISQTQIIGTQSATAAALKVGEPLIATGTKNQDTLAAVSVQILLSLSSSVATNF